MTAPPHRQYNCSKCPAYCCSYDEIEVRDADLVRLARHFDVSVDEAEIRYTKETPSGTRIMRHRKDEIFGSTCQFLDPEERRCTIYGARPRICRAYPGTTRCGFYDFLSSERRSQDDPEYVPSFTRG